MQKLWEWRKMITEKSGVKEFPRQKEFSERKMDKGDSVLREIVNAFTALWENLVFTSLSKWG